jgi:hypothetical protein
MAVFSHKPGMKKMFDGRNIACRPIPVFHDQSDMIAIAVAAADQRSRASAVNMPSAPGGHVGGVQPVFGTQVGSLAKFKTGVYNPGTGQNATI